MFAELGNKRDCAYENRDERVENRGTTGGGDVDEPGEPEENAGMGDSA